MLKITVLGIRQKPPESYITPQGTEAPGDFKDTQFNHGGGHGRTPGLQTEALLSKSSSWGPGHTAPLLQHGGSRRPIGLPFSSGSL